MSHNFMADSDSNGDEPNKSFNAQQVAAGNSDAGQKWHGFAAYAKIMTHLIFG